MKQILFLILFPCFALAQYTGNSNQKITLGEQTTADGLVFRGNAADTVTATLKITKTNKSDTSAFLLLDTLNNVLLKYNIATTFWTRLNLLPTDTTSMLTNYYRSGRALGTPTSGVVTNLTGTASININGTVGATTTSTGSFTTLAASGAVTLSGATVNGVPFVNASNVLTTGSALTFDNADRLIVGAGSAVLGARVEVVAVGSGDGIAIRGRASDNTSKLLFINNANSTSIAHLLGQPGILSFSLSDSEKMRITSTGDVGIGTISPQSGYRLHVVDSVYVGGNVSASAYTTRSDYDLKDEIQNISYGINEVMQMQPVKYTYKSNGSTQLGFIAQDLGVITPEVVSFEDKMSVYYNALIPILTKAIQEQQALIKTLEQRILTLENK